MKTRQITFTTDNDELLDNMVRMIVESGVAGSIDIAAEEQEEDVDVLDLVDGFEITNDYLNEAEHRYMLRDAIAKHIKECDESKDTDDNYCFSAKTSSYWFLPYAALRQSVLARCSISTFIDQMAQWFPNLIKDVRNTKKHVKQLATKFSEEKIVSWNVSPKVRYARRKQARTIAYDGVFCTLNRLKKDIIKLSAENT